MAILLVSGCQSEELAELAPTDELPESSITSVAYEPTITAGTLVFDDMDDYVTGSQAIVNTNERSYAAWAEANDFESLYMIRSRAERDYYSGAQSRAQIETRYPFITVGADSSVKLRDFSLSGAKTLSARGIVVIDGEVQYKSSSLYLRYFPEDTADLEAALRMGIDEATPGVDVVLDWREGLVGRDFAAVQNCGTASNAEWVVDPPKQRNADRDRHHDVRFEMDVTVTGSATVGYRVQTTFRTDSESFKSENNRYSTNHSLQILSARQRRDLEPTSLVDFDLRNSVDGKEITSYFPFGNFYPVNAPTATSAVNAAAMMFTRITPGRENTPSFDQTSYLTHRGMGTGSMFLVSCN